LRDDDIEYIKATILFKKAVDFLVQMQKYYKDSLFYCQCGKTYIRLEIDREALL